MNRSLRLWIVPAALVVGLFGAAACGSTNNTTKSNSGAAVASAPAAAGTPGAGAVINEVEKDNSYSVTKMTAKAGEQITINVTNTGSALHNVHFTDVKDASGKDVQSQLTDKTATLSFTVAKPGTYHFRCDAHPSDMMGTLTIQ